MKRISSVLLTICATAAIAVTAAAVTAATPAPTDSAVTARSHGVTMDDDEEEDLGPCKRSEFKTQLVKDACAKGGQLDAKKAMKRFVKDAKKKLDVGNVTCNTCHDELAPEYSLKDDALARFEEWQQKLAEKRAAPAE